jgi:hypothetical protein
MTITIQVNKSRLKVDLTEDQAPNHRPEKTINLSRRTTIARFVYQSLSTPFWFRVGMPAYAKSAER